MFRISREGARSSVRVLSLCSHLCWFLATAVVATASAAQTTAEAPPTPSSEPPPVSAHGHEEEPEEIVITGRERTREGVTTIDGDHSLPAAADSAAYARLVPGGDVNMNGPLTGQIQYRGLFGPRLNVRIDGAAPISGGPNWMDPPLHYAPRPLLDRLEFERGVAPVSEGAESLGGTARAVLVTSDFSDGDVEVHGDLELAGRAPRGEFAGGGILSVSNDWARVHVVNATEFGTDWRSPEGTVRSTKHERYTGGIGGGVRLGGQDIGVDYRHFRTQDTGTPALPMDIRFFDTEVLGGNWSTSVGDAEIRARLDWQDVDHGMDNFSQRRAPASPAGFRRIKAHADRLAWGAGAAKPLAGGVFEVGVEGDQSQYDSQVINPNVAAFFVNTFRNAKRNRAGAFVEWSGPVHERAEFLAGFRYTRVDMNSGVVDALPAQLMAAPGLLRDTFNAADRSKSDDHYDYALRGRFEVTPELQLEIGHSRKTRSATFFERYAWIPLEVTGGLADGNNHVGNLDLDPEVSYEVDAGIELDLGPLHFAPRVFYRYVDQYIQGVPVLPTDPNGMQLIGVSTVNGDATPLRYDNVDAELWGIDAEIGLALPLDLHVDATISYVRGKRKDIRDELYRVSPLHGRVALGWIPSWGSLVAEVQWAARQGRVSQTNGEFTTDGWAILNLIGSLRVMDGVELLVGVENVTDNLYRDHLAGFNRNADSATALGQRLPGRGATAFARVGWIF